MNKWAYLMGVALLLNGATMNGQSILDAYKYSQTELNGTARYLSMGGAFGALGGDISVLTANPAGLGIYKSSEVATTLNVNSIKANSNWGEDITGSKTRFNFSNIAYVGYFPTGKEEGLVSWNVGFSYNRIKDFTRNYRLSGMQNSSLADYAAIKATTVMYGGAAGIPEGKMPAFNATGDKVHEAYEQLGGAGWLPGLAYQGGLIGADVEGGSIYHSAYAAQKENGAWDLMSYPNLSDLEVAERGAIDQYNFSFATNISDRFFLGATVGIQDLSYKMNSKYSEYFDYSDGTSDYLYWDNDLDVDGKGYSVNVGAIFRPVDFFRVGIAYNSPTWFKMTDYYWGNAESYIGAYATPEDPDAALAQGDTPYNPDPFTEYKLRTPDKWIISMAGFFGTSGLISIDYEVTNFKRMNLRDNNDYDYPDNELIDEQFGLSHNIKVGAEFRVTPQFSVRAGGNWKTSPMEVELKEGRTEVYTAGTIPNFTLDKGLSSYSVGLGYRFTPRFYMDLACVYRIYKEDAYTFSNLYQDGRTLLKSEAIGLDTKTTQVSLTMGYKF